MQVGRPITPSASEACRSAGRTSGILDKFGIKTGRRPEAGSRASSPRALTARLRRLARGAPKRTVRAIRTYWADTPFREQFMTGLVVVFGVVIAMGGFFLIQSYTRSQAQHEFQGPANQFAATLSEAVDGYVGLILAWVCYRIAIWWDPPTARPAGPTSPPDGPA